MKKIAIFGAGGLGREVKLYIDYINEQDAVWDFIGFFDDVVKKGENGVLGSIEDLNKWNEPLDVFIAIGNPAGIKMVVSKIVNPQISFPNIISPDMKILDKGIKIGVGNFLGCYCVTTSNIEIGDFNIFNVKVSIGHDAKIGSYNTFMPNVAISGRTTIGNENFFGVSSIILQGVKVGSNTRVGAASVLIRKTKDNNLYMGNPATIVKF